MTPFIFYPLTPMRYMVYFPYLRGEGNHMEHIVIVSPQFICTISIFVLYLAQVSDGQRRQPARFCESSEATPLRQEWGFFMFYSHYYFQLWYPCVSKNLKHEP